MPAYSTWQPTEGKIVPIASADQTATRRLVDPRGDLVRGKPIVSALLGVCGGPSDPSMREARPPSGSPFLVPPARACRSVLRTGPISAGQDRRCRLVPAIHDRPVGAVVGFFTRLRNRPDRPFRPNDSARFQKMLAIEGAEQSESSDSMGLLSMQARIMRGLHLTGLMRLSWVRLVR
jgi:hypothetical protein